MPLQYVILFARRRKKIGLKLLKSDEKYQKLFHKLGGWEVTNEMFVELQEFTCLMYGGKKCKDVNNLRYQMFVKRKGKNESQHLSACMNALYKHCLRPNYQSCVWKRCLDANPTIPSAVGSGWIMEEDTGKEDLRID